MIYIQQKVKHHFLQILVCVCVGGGGGWSGPATVQYNFQCRGALIISMVVGQGLRAYRGTGGGCLDILSLFLSPFIWETSRPDIDCGLHGFTVNNWVIWRRASV